MQLRYWEDSRAVGRDCNMKNKVLSKMKFSHLIKIKLQADETVKSELLNAVMKEMRRIADFCTKNNDEITVAGVNNSFGSILRNDTTVIRIKPSSDGSSMLLESVTDYNPSMWFWIFFAIDILLIETVIGFVVGMGLTLGLYFSNKNLVQNGLQQALQNAAESIG